MDKYIVWQCDSCHKTNLTEPHADGACFPSMICEYCDSEIDGCLCGSTYDLSLKRIEEFFNQAGINKTGICKESGITIQYVNRVLNWTEPLTHETLQKLAPVMIKYGLQVDER